MSRHSEQSAYLSGLCFLVQDGKPVVRIVPRLYPTGPDYLDIGEMSQGTQIA